MKKVLIAIVALLLSVAIFTGCAPDNRNVTPTPAPSPILTPAISPAPVVSPTPIISPDVSPTPGTDDNLNLLPGDNRNGSDMGRDAGGGL